MASLVRLHAPLISSCRSMKNLPGLESLNITECSLKTTNGLEGLTRLTALHLSSNHLQSLGGVRGMTSLRKLWANDNRIKSVSKAQRAHDHAIAHSSIPIWSAQRL